MSMKRQKPGPKPLAARDKRSFKVQVPLNAGEIASVRKAAGKTTLGAWARAVLMAATKDLSPIGGGAPMRATRKGRS
jgi:hypothetical protein